MSVCATATSFSEPICVPTPATVLLVDDEPYVLDGLNRTVRGSFEVVTATTAEGGLAVLRAKPSVAVVVSDLRMPGTDGIAFLAAVRRMAPDVVRILLTGHGDVETAIKAVNDGQVFRFLRKPTPSSTLATALKAAAEQHALVIAERVLLEGTLHGCVHALADVLAISNPLAFSRALRVKEAIGAFAEQVGLENRWQLEVAATLSQIGTASLPHDVAEKVYFGRPLSDDEQRLVGRLPGYAATVASRIPRLETVRDILWHLHAPSYVGSSEPVSDAPAPAGALLLRIAFDFDVLVTQGRTVQSAVAELAGRIGVYDTHLLREYSAWQGERCLSTRTRSLCVAELTAGMTLATDIVDDHGVLLIAHGQRVTVRALDLIRSYFAHDSLKRRVHIRLDDEATGEPTLGTERSHVA
jgi:response regulator RpfG family c-di-GMP phosphodiesterase